MKAAIYCRVSRDDKEQNPERQLLKCKQYCDLHNHDVIFEVMEYHKGDSSPSERPKFNDIKLNDVDGIIVYSIDRLTRQHPNKVMTLLNHFKQSGVLIISVTEPIFNMESEFAEPMQYFMSWWNNYFLRKLSNDVKSGLERARKQGKRLGRPETKANKYQIQRLRSEGLSIRGIALQLNLSKSKVERCLKNT